jgi:hypothetical protein
VNRLGCHKHYFAGDLLEDETGRASEVWIEAKSASIGRSCGSCSLCCKLLRIEDPELSKPPNQWCPHCRPGRGGCSIYDGRPSLCRGFACLWLINSEVQEEWFPLKSKMVITPEFRENCPWPEMVVYVDPGFPAAWRQEPYLSMLNKAAKHLRPDLTQPGKLVFIVKVREGKREWWITGEDAGDGVIEITPETVKRLQEALCPVQSSP